MSVAQEASRIIRRAKDVDVFGDRVSCKTQDDLIACAQRVMEGCAGKTITLVSPIDEEDRRELLVALIIPCQHEGLLRAWYPSVVQSARGKTAEMVVGGSKCITSSAGSIEWCEVIFAPNTEQSPLKKADEFLADSFAHLRKVGVYKDADEEDKEYNFDDL